jgi:hypothetical protein
MFKTEIPAKVSKQTLQRLLVSSGKENADRWATIINDFWTAKGMSVKATTVFIDTITGVRGYWTIKSSLINGLPLEWWMKK